MSTTPLRSDTGTDTAAVTARTVIDSLSSHASCRHYLSDPIPDDDLDAMMHAAQRSATSSNLQMWSAVIVRDGKRRSAMARLCGDQRHIAAAPLFIAWCADRNRLDIAAEARGYRQDVSTTESFLVAAVDTAIAMQNAVVAAEAMGYGTCYIGAIRNDTAAVCELLRLPRHVVPIAGMTVGVPDDRRDGATKPRLPLSTVVHHEEYTAVAPEVLTSYDEQMRNTGVYSGRQQDGVRPDGSSAVPIPADEYGWMEHSARRTSTPRRPDLTDTIRRQGFPLE